MAGLRARSDSTARHLLRTSRVLLCTLLVPGLSLGRPSLAAAGTAARADYVLQAAEASATISVDGRLDEGRLAEGAPRPRIPPARPEPGGARDRAHRSAHPLRRPRPLRRGAGSTTASPARIGRQLSRRDVVAEADSFSLFLDPHHDHRTGVEFQVSAAGVQRDARDLRRQLRGRHLGRGLGVGGDGRRRGLDRGDADPLLAAPLPGSSPAHLGGQRAARRPQQERGVVAGPGAQERERARLPHGPPRGHRAGSRPGDTSSSLPYASVRAEHVEPARPGDPWNDGSRLFGGAGLDFKYGVGSGHGARGRDQPRLRPGGGRPGGGQPHRLRDLLRGEAPVLHRGQPGLPPLRPQRGERLHDLLLPRAAALLFATDRPGAAGDAPRATSWTRPPPPPSWPRPSSWGARRGLEPRPPRRRDRRASTRAVSAGLARDRTSRSSRSPTTSWAGRSGSWAGGRPRLPGNARCTAAWTRAASTACSSTSAFVAGADGHVFLDRRRDWVVSGGLAGSTVSGSPAAVLRLQRASQRYYQRPDAPHVSVDPAATSLSGWSGRVGLNKNSGNVTFDAGLWGISPGFEPNDLGFATQTDRAGGHGLVLFRKLTPGPLHAHPTALGREVVDLELRPRVPGRRRAGGGRGPAPQLLAARPRPWAAPGTPGTTSSRGAAPPTIRPGIRSLLLAVSTRQPPAILGERLGRPCRTAISGAGASCTGPR